jgi:hypothetical protein
MDYLRAGKAYRSQMRTYVGLPAVPVVWFKCAPGAPLVRGPSYFRSKNWTEWDDWSGLGEQVVMEQCCQWWTWVKEYYKGGAPAPYGISAPCGNPAIPARGGIWGVDPPLTIRPDGSATCCTMASIAMEGGEREGGDFPMSGFFRAMFGGEREGGTLLIGSPYQLYMSGGEREGGDWPRVGGLVFTAQGGEGEGGAARSSYAQIPVAGGGEGEGGTGYPGGLSILTAAGGQGEGGTAAQALSIAQIAAGGQGEGGSGSVPAYSSITADGGEGEGGTGYPAGLVRVTASGGQGEGGAARQAVQASQTAEGGQGEGGAATVGGYTVWTADGGQGEGGAAAVLPISNIVATGGQGEGGAALVGGYSTIVAMGGQGEGGTAIQPSRADQTASGGQGEGGSAVMATVTIVARGGQGEGGTAMQPRGPQQTATGGQGEGGVAGWVTCPVICSACPGYATSTWQVSVTGALAPPNGLNGGWTLSYLRSCTWWYEDLTVLVTLFPRQGQWILQQRTGTHTFEFALGLGIFDCQNFNTMLPIAGSGVATLTPFPCPPSWQTDCCPNPIPSVLRSLTVDPIGIFGGQATVWIRAILGGGWVNHGAFGACGPSSCVLNCVGGQWTLQTPTQTLTADSSSCDPLSVIFAHLDGICGFSPGGGISYFP